MIISYQGVDMESEKATGRYGDNQEGSLQSLQSRKKDSRASSLQKDKNNFNDKIQDEEEKDSCAESRSKTSDPDRDQISDGEGQRSSGSFYSKDYENESPSERSLSPYSRSLTPSPTPQKGVRAKRITGNPLYKTGGVGRQGLSRPQRLGRQPLTQQNRKGVRPQSKESTAPKDLDLVTKRMLSDRLLKINELHNALAELQQRTDELQKENRTLRRVLLRQEKDLHRYNDTDSEISQLLSRHSNEKHVLRELLRRTQDRGRTAERRLKDREEQLQRSQTTIARLKKLVDRRELGARDELSRRLEDEKSHAEEAERKIKELERSIELSNSSYQRQLAAERKKTLSAQEEIRTLQEDLQRLTNKLKEKERELDAKNIYANRMVKPSQRKDTDSCTKQKGSSKNNSKAVQTEDRLSSLGFPTPPPPAITDANDCHSERGPDEYLSLEELGRADRRAETENRHQNGERQKMSDKEKDRDGEKEQLKQQLNQEMGVLEERAKILKDATMSTGWEKETEGEARKKTSSLLNQKEKENNRKRGHVHEEVGRWNQEALVNQQAAEEARQKKEQLLAKMREIDRLNQGVQENMFAESRLSEFHKSTSGHYSPRPPEQRNHNHAIFSLKSSEESATLAAGDGFGEGGRRRPGTEGGAVTTALGRRALRTQMSSDDLAFGSYAPSFGLSSRGAFGFPSPPPKEDKDSRTLEGIGVFSLRGAETEKDTDMEKGAGKGKKSSLMQQLFGSVATPVGDIASTSNKMEIISNPPTNGVRLRRDRLHSFNSGSSSPPPASSLSILHVAESRPAVRAIASFDDDIEELTL
ncbi:lebercilin isoform X4 [Scophthalmus maximus]|uniref:lebercilin isoform X4 n=1 Tax=Scophthalmus maximus TaxID=52904 RepID=UPI0015E07792|nr:lebercilin isoform X4 [Scophthalmus maximus]XP_035473576.1 lebercilin isoform X4 [Scophthalmus maximus]XP_035473577.1 lebercilin isoform X4 [Scophthalmus maximus]